MCTALALSDLVPLNRPPSSPGRTTPTCVEFGSQSRRWDPLEALTRRIMYVFLDSGLKWTTDPDSWCSQSTQVLLWKPRQYCIVQDTYRRHLRIPPFHSHLSSHATGLNRARRGRACRRSQFYLRGLRCQRNLPSKVHTCFSSFSFLLITVPTITALDGAGKHCRNARRSKSTIMVR